MTDGTDYAPKGQVWVCAACGKRARTRYGFNAAGAGTAIDRGWDESCMLNAILCFEEKKDGVFVPVEDLPQ